MLYDTLHQPHSLTRRRDVVIFSITSLGVSTNFQVPFETPDMRPTSGNNVITTLTNELPGWSVSIGDGITTFQMKTVIIKKIKKGKN